LQRSCKVHWGWRRDFRIFTLNCNNYIISNKAVI
jgi:hypothetical protein